MKSGESVASLTSDLENLGLAEEEIEIEREMIDGLDQLVKLQTALAAEGLPVIETGHRVVGTDVCHFSAPSSMPDDPAQPSGRLILTSARAIFTGGARAMTLRRPLLPSTGVLDNILLSCYFRAT